MNDLMMELDELVNEPAITIERSPEFSIIAHEVGDHIKTLPLTNGQNNALVELLIRQITEAESTAFKQGFSIAINVLFAHLSRHYRL